VNAGTAGVETPGGVSSVLRAETAEHHRRAEQSTFQQAFVSGRLPRSLYIGWLVQMWYVYDALEARLWTAPCREKHAGLLSDARRRTPELMADLAYFAVPTSSAEAMATTQTFVRHLTAWAEARSLALFGAFYVLEGSTNGSRHIARVIRKSYGLSGREGTAFLDPYGDAQPDRWADFKRHLDAALTVTDTLELVSGARVTFDALTTIGQELLDTGSS
jgi:heme oxygenase